MSMKELIDKILELKDTVQKILENGCSRAKQQEYRQDRLEMDVNALGKKIDSSNTEFQKELRIITENFDNKVSKLHTRINQILLLAIGQLAGLVIVLLTKK